MFNNLTHTIHCSGGWHGFKEMVVLKKKQESTDVTFFYFGHADGSTLADNFKPGQYISLQIPQLKINHYLGGDVEHDVTRNYSLSCAPFLGYYRCSIKREKRTDPAGIISNYMHDRVKVGSKILVRKS